MQRSRLPQFALLLTCLHGFAAAQANTSGGGNIRVPGSGGFERLERAIQQLPEDMRQVLVLRSVDGLPSQEVARKLGKSDAAVRKAYSRAVAQLASRMGADGTD